MMLDGDRLRERLEEMQRSLTQTVADRVAGNGGEKDETTHRMEGGIANLHLLLTQLHHFEVVGVTPRTPKGEISRPTKTKLRRKDPDTSLDAALQQTPEKSQALYRALYLVLSRKPMSDEQLVDLFRKKHPNLTPSGIRSRRSELAEEGWVRDSGEKIPTAAGGQSIVWEAVP